MFVEVTKTAMEKLRLQKDGFCGTSALVPVVLKKMFLDTSCICDALYSATQSQVFRCSLFKCSNQR